MVHDLDNTENDSPQLDNISISSLLYADDLVLLSTTKEGLQNLLNTLESFTTKWFMNLNMSKTKTLTFSRKLDLNSYFTFGSKQIESCSNYTYLGTVFTWNGSFKLAMKTLRDKATKAMYGLISKIFKFKNCDFVTSSKLFDSLIKPILTYNSEVWGTALLPSNPQNNKCIDFSNLNDLIEGVHLKFLKHCIGTNEYTSNWAVLTETGKTPLKIFIFGHIVKYWWHLNTSESPILQAAMKTNTVFAENNIKCWTSGVTKILNWIGIECISEDNRVEINQDHVNQTKSKLYDKFLLEWDSHRTSILNNPDSKLKILAHITEGKFHTALHLDLKCNYKIKNSLSRFRLSTHCLPIETMRHLNIPRNLRVCPFCCTSLGDEQHFLLSCKNPDISLSRENTIGQLKLCTTDSFENMILILKETDPGILLAVAKHLKNIDAILKL